MRRALRAAAGTLLALALAAPACSTAGLREAYTALDEAGDRRRTTFFTDTAQIFCVAELASGRPDVTVDMIVRATTLHDFAANRGRAVDVVMTTVEHAPGRAPRARLSAELQRKGPDGTVVENLPYPVGEYLCEVYIDGELQTSLPFDVAFPDCPAYSLTPQAPCFGFYRLDTKCPAFGASSLDKSTCTCTAEGWQC